MIRAPSLSVVIPTRDRSDHLRATLVALAEQELVGSLFEVVVADDGSSDGTPQLLQEFRSETFALRSIRLPGNGPATARNRAIHAAKGDRVLLLGDDTRPAPGTLRAHLSTGRAQGLQGRIDWDPSRPVTPVMRFLAPAGPQFYFKGLTEGKKVPYWGVLASNLSAPRDWFLNEPYDEAFPAAALEDTELAFRWRRRGWEVLFSDRALCWHDHTYESLEPFLERQRRAGRAARRALLLHPSLVGRLLLQPLLLGVAVAARLAARRALGGEWEEDLWDLRVRASFFSGFIAPRGEGRS